MSDAQPQAPACYNNYSAQWGFGQPSGYVPINDLDLIDPYLLWIDFVLVTVQIDAGEAFFNGKLWFGTEDAPNTALIGAACIFRFDGTAWGGSAISETWTNSRGFWLPQTEGDTKAFWVTGDSSGGYGATGMAVTVSGRLYGSAF